MSLGLGIDTGGTCADSAIIDLVTGKIARKAKALATRKDLSIGIFNSINKLDKSFYKDIELVSASSTLTANSVVEGKGCRAGLIVVGEEFNRAINVDGLIEIRGGARAVSTRTSVKKTRIVPERYRKEETGKGSLRLNQVATLIMILISLALIWYLPRSGGLIAIATSMFFGICASAFLPLFVHTLFAKRPSRFATRISLVVGSITWFIWTSFACTTTSKVVGLCKALTGNDSLLTKPLSIVDPIVIALPLSILALMLGWYFDKKIRKGLTSENGAA